MKQSFPTLVINHSFLFQELESITRDKLPEQLVDDPDSVQAPGALSGPAPEIPDWYKVGWRDVSGIDAPPPGGDLKDRNIIATFISDQVSPRPLFINTIHEARRYSVA